jgi:BirA family biotin operon repressor/biotin-[acetyl-CoA-carboxylase] ligase
MAETPARALLDPSVVTHALGDHANVYRISALAECDSTNTRLMAAAEAGASGGSVLVADRQTAGRGRRGRIWHSSPEDSLTFSVLWRFPASSEAPAALSLVTGLAVATALETLGAPAIALKWPNDVLHDGRKLAGILIELQPGDLRSTVIGIGLNLRLPDGLPEEVASTATALDRVCSGAGGKNLQREIVLAAILGQLADTFAYYSREGFAALRAAWCKRDAYAHRPVVVIGERSRQSGICVGVDNDGALLLQGPDGNTRIIAGELSLRDGTGALT